MGLLGRLRRSEDGMVTVEAAFALAAIASFLILSAIALAAISMQIRCVDAAREGARLAAAGDARARDAAVRVAPSGANIAIRIGADEVVVEVDTSVPMLPMWHVSARAVATPEPDSDSGGSAAVAPQASR